MSLIPAESVLPARIVLSSVSVESCAWTPPTRLAELSTIVELRISASAKCSRIAPTLSAVIVHALRDRPTLLRSRRATARRLAGRADASDSRYSDIDTR